MAPITLLTIPGRSDPSLCLPSQGFLPDNEASLSWLGEGLGLGGSRLFWPVKPFETLPVIKGYTNPIYLISYFSLD